MSFKVSEENMIFNMKLVKEVEKREILYNITLPEYSQKELAENAWREVSKEVGLPALDCREKWRNLRAVYIRKLKPSPQGSRRNKTAYYLAEAMQFCKPYIRPPNPWSSSSKPTTTNHNMTEDNDQITIKSETLSDYFEDTTDISQLSEEEKNESILSEYQNSIKYSQATPNTLKIDASKEEERKEAIKMFLLSLVPEVENFTDLQMKQFRRQVLHVIDDISGT